MSLSWLKKKPLRIGLGSRRIMVSGGKPVELEPGDDWRGAVSALPEILKAHKESRRAWCSPTSSRATRCCRTTTR